MSGVGFAFRANGTRRTHARLTATLVLPHTQVPTDAGGAYVGPTQDRLLRLARVRSAAVQRPLYVAALTRTLWHVLQEVGVETYKLPVAGKNVCVWQGSRKEVRLRQLFGPWPVACAATP